MEIQNMNFRRLVLFALTSCAIAVSFLGEGVLGVAKVLLLIATIMLWMIFHSYLTGRSILTKHYRSAGIQIVGHEMIVVRMGRSNLSWLFRNKLHVRFCLSDDAFHFSMSTILHFGHPPLTIPTSALVTIGPAPSLFRKYFRFCFVEEPGIYIDFPIKIANRLDAKIVS